VCPFLRDMGGDEGHLCLSDPEDPESINPTYVATVCSRPRYFTCKRFVRSDPATRRAMVAAAAGSEAPAGEPDVAAPPPVPDTAATAAVPAVITFPPPRLRTDETELMISGTAPAGATVALFDGETRVAETETDESGEWSAIVSMEEPGRHVWTASCLDDSGQVSSPSSPSIVTLISPRAAPVPPAPAAAPPAMATASATTAPPATNVPADVPRPEPPVEEAMPAAHAPAEAPEPLPSPEPEQPKPPEPVVAPKRPIETTPPPAPGRDIRPQPEGHDVDPRSSATRTRFPGKKLALAGAAAAVIIAFGVVEFPRLHHSAGPRPTVLPAVSRPTVNATAPAAAPTPLPTLGPTVAGTGVASNGATLTSWQFKPLPGHPKRVLIGIFNPSTFGVVAAVRVVQGGHEEDHVVRVPAGRTVQLSPDWLTPDAVTVEASPEVIPLRMATH
jgi:hypothetical protein